MFVGTNDVPWSFFLFLCSAINLAFASSVKMMFLIFALKTYLGKEKKIEKY
jgi:hypothetical protein